jgi:transmembrane sensor
MNNNLHWNLIVGKLSKKLTDEKSESFDKWLSENDNIRIYKEIKSLWDSVQTKVGDYNPNTDRCWKKMSSYIDSKEQKITRKIPAQRFARSLAASISLLLILGSVFYFIAAHKNEDSVTFEYVNINGKSNISLPDGSNVWLQHNTKLSYMEREGKREIYMNGEAFFDVVHDKKHVFVVHAGEADVKVYGTRFEVDSHSGGKDVGVVLVEGSVSMSAHNKQIFLHPGEQGKYNKETDKWQVGKTDAEFASIWAKKKLQFENQSLGYICKCLSKWYGVDISLNPALKEGQAYTFTLENQTLEEIMFMLSRISDFTYYFNESGILYINPKDNL